MEYNQNNLEAILNDLYNIDPSLKEHEQELIQVIKQLIASKPEAELDESFRIRLKNEILAMVNEIRQGTAKEKESSTNTWPWVRGILLPVTYGFVGAFVIVMIIVPLFFGSNESNNKGPVALLDDQGSEERTFVSAPEESLPIAENKAAEDSLGGGATANVIVEPYPATLPTTEELSIRLGSNPSTGFSWVVDFDKQYIELISEEFEENGGGASGLVGAPGKQVFKFKGIQTGQTDIIFSYIRPWEGEQTDTQKQIYQVTIK